MLKQADVKPLHTKPKIGFKDISEEAIESKLVWN
jgi:hypothetical protein